MTKIEGFRVRNFKVLKEVVLGRLWNLQGYQPLTPLTAVIGKTVWGKVRCSMHSGFFPVPSGRR